VFSPEALSLIQSKIVEAKETIQNLVTQKIERISDLKGLFRLAKDGSQITSALTNNFSVPLTIKERNITVRHEGRGSYCFILPDNDLYSTLPFTQMSRTIPLSHDTIKHFLIRPQTEDEQRDIRQFFNEYEFGGPAKLEMRKCSVVLTQNPDWYEDYEIQESLKNSINSALDNFKKVKVKRARVVSDRSSREERYVPKVEKEFLGYQLFTDLSEDKPRLSYVKATNPEPRSLYLALESFPENIREAKGLLQRAYYCTMILKRPLFLVEKNNLEKVKQLESFENIWKHKDLSRFEARYRCLSYQAQCPGWFKQLKPYGDILENHWNDEEKNRLSIFLESLEKGFDRIEYNSLNVLLSSETKEDMENSIKRDLVFLQKWMLDNSFLTVLNFNLDLREELPILLRYYKDKK
jgi:hypothetical protein